MIDIKKIKAAAIATKSSKFKVTEQDYGDELWFGGEGCGLIDVGGWSNGGCKSDNPKKWKKLLAEAKHIATANPQAVIELITRLEAAEKQRDELLAALEGILNSPETRIGYDQYQSACDAITSVKGDAA